MIKTSKMTISDFLGIQQFIKFQSITRILNVSSNSFFLLSKAEKTINALTPTKRKNAKALTIKFVKKHRNKTW